MQALLATYPNLEIRAASVHDLIWAALDTPTSTPLSSSSSLMSPNTWARVGGVRLGEEAFLFYSAAAKFDHSDCESTLRYRRGDFMSKRRLVYWDFPFWRDTSR